jgi:hypothetical protein
MDEVRVWKGVRTEAQIRENMFKNLTGKEEGLAGLWNFEDGSANDASPAAHHGNLMGQAKVVEAALPSATTLVPWSRLLVQVNDAGGAPVQNVTLRAEVNGTEVGRATGFPGIPLTVWTTAPAVDLVASGSNDLGGWQLAVPITPYTERTNEWKLRLAIHLAGRVTALDGKTPHAALVVELVQPIDGSSRGDEAPSESQKSEVRSQKSEQSFFTPTWTNGVLQLDGKSYAELPPHIFQELTEATIEGWIKWERLVSSADFVDLGAFNSEMWISPGGGGVQSTTDDLTAFIAPAPLTRYSIRVSTILRTNEWFHIAFVTGSGGVKLFVNGVLAGTNVYTGSFASLTNNSRNYLGRDGNPEPNLPTLTGQLDDFRVWRVQRTAEQIRDAMFKKLGGAEPDLVGLWNFDDPAQPGRDASSGAHHGKLIGQATVTNAALPGLVLGNITDTSGKPLANASVNIHQPGQPDRRITANATGEYGFTISSTER